MTATETGKTLKPKIACRLFSSQYAEMAIVAAKNVICQTNVKKTAKPLYVQKIRTDVKSLMTPIKNEIIDVKDVIVIETAASDIVIPIRSGTESLLEVCRHAANITNVSSIPMPEKKQ